MTSLQRTESLRLMQSVSVGRIVFTDKALPAIRPVNFGVMSDGDVIVRSAAGSKVADVVPGTVVAFEVDSFTDSSREAWSVVIVGIARLVTDPDELQEIDGAMPDPWAPGERRQVIRIRPDIVEGRRLPGLQPG